MIPQKISRKDAKTQREDKNKNSRERAQRKKANRKSTQISSYLRKSAFICG